MEANLKAIADFLNEYLWSMPLVVLALVIGVYFTLRLRVVQIRKIKDMVTLLFSGESSEEGLSSFQAFALALSGRVGTGNIAGVATAIGAGGPGAVFWMWMLAFLGASTAFVECTLAQLFKTEIADEYRGGAAYYIERGFYNTPVPNWIGKIFGGIFAIAIGIASLALLPGIHANAITESMQNAFGINKVITGIIILAALATIIFGGSKRIGRFAEIVVPFMASFYILFALIVIVMNASQLPAVFGLIFSSAFGTNAVFGGILGTAVTMGVKRGIYSSESGMGTATQSAASANVSHPAKQGLVQGFSVYIDTLFICTATALMIIITDAYNVISPNGKILHEGIAGIEAGTLFTQGAVDRVFSFGAEFVAISLFFFAFTTIVNTFYNCETNVLYFFREGHNKIVILFTRLIFLGTTFFGAVSSAEVAWAFADVGIGIISWLNLIAVLILGHLASKVLKDFEQQQQQGIDPVFNPKKLGITHAEIWERNI